MECSWGDLEWSIWCTRFSFWWMLSFLWVQLTNYSGPNKEMACQNRVWYGWYGCLVVCIRTFQNKCGINIAQITMLTSLRTTTFISKYSNFRSGQSRSFPSLTNNITKNVFLKNKKVTPPFQNVGCFGFFKFIVFAMHLDITYV